MKFCVKGRLEEFLHGCNMNFPVSDDYKEISYEELKRYWVKHKECQSKFSCIYELLQGCEIKWENFYPQKKVKSPEELRAYKARLQELEYKQLTKGMDSRTDDYFKVSI